MTVSADSSAAQLQLQQALLSFRQDSAKSTPGHVLDLLRLIAARLDSRLAKASAAIDKLAVKSTDLDTRIADAVARADILSMSKFIEQACVLPHQTYCAECSSQFMRDQVWLLTRSRRCPAAHRRRRAHLGASSKRGQRGGRIE